MPKVTVEISADDLELVKVVSEEMKMTVEEYMLCAAVPPINDRTMEKMNRRVAEINRIFTQYCHLVKQLRDGIWE